MLLHVTDVSAAVIIFIVKKFCNWPKLNWTEYEHHKSHANDKHSAKYTGDWKQLFWFTFAKMTPSFVCSFHNVCNCKHSKTSHRVLLWTCLSHFRVLQGKKNIYLVMQRTGAAIMRCPRSTMILVCSHTPLFLLTYSLLITQTLRITTLISYKMASFW